MLWNRRTSPVRPLRQTLTVETLENRTLLDGNVTAFLDPAGSLQITGDAADNQFLLAPAPTPGMIRVSGNPGTFTAINGDAFADFSLADITDIIMNLQVGRDSVTLADFSITGSLTILYGNAAAVFTLTNFNASSINLIFTGYGGVLGSGNNGGLLPPVG
ncbi:MAG: hypothetical protein L0Z62_20235 [Gemmataceae bacterium]|nr:hypothetical protein [Gemmataceae bacterium]